MKEQSDAVKRMQNYITAHFDENITLADLSAASMYSPWHSYRLFILYLKMTPSEYIRKYRLSKSALKLRNKKVKIADIAFEVGFNSVDGYQRAFYREFGCNPQEYALNPQNYLFAFTKTKNKYKKEFTMENVSNVFISVVEKPERKVIIKRGIKANDYWSYGVEVGCDIWEKLLAIPYALGEPVCLYLPKKYILPNTSEYVQGVEVALDFKDVPEGFDVIELPACKYLRFQGEKFAEEDYEKAITQVWSAIEKFDPSTIGFSIDNENPRIALEPKGERGYIELIAIK